MHRDDLGYLKKLATGLGPDKHFSVSQMHRVVYPKKAGSWVMFEQDDLRAIMGRLVREGLAVESVGPRGGAGWKLTSTAMQAATKKR